MRCACCDKILNDSELHLRNPHTGNFADLCGDCFVISYITEDDYYDDSSDLVNDLVAKQGIIPFRGEYE